MSADVALKPDAQVVDLPAALPGLVRGDVDPILRVGGEHGVIDMAIGHRPSFLHECVRTAGSPRLPETPPTRLATRGLASGTSGTTLFFCISFVKLLGSNTSFVMCQQPMPGQ